MAGKCCIIEKKKYKLVADLDIETKKWNEFLFPKHNENYPGNHVVILQNMQALLENWNCLHITHQSMKFPHKIQYTFSSNLAIINVNSYVQNWFPQYLVSYLLSINYLHKCNSATINISKSATFSHLNRKSSGKM